jgi:2-desacetyl-2-hydroxyethyl bacteriochlorophyllide A dehydrogenase
MSDGPPNRSMKQAFLPERGKALAVQDVPIPMPTEGEVLLRTSVATVCARTDLNIMAGIHPPHVAGIGGMLPHDLRVRLGRDDEDPLRRLYPDETCHWPAFPAPMGHEAAGTVVELGPEANSPETLVFPGQPLSIGDRVATFKVPAGYSEYAVVSTSNVVRIPDFMNDDEGSLLEPLMPNYNCLRRCWAMQPPRTVAILGGGFQGLVATQVVRAMGAELVIVSEPLARKRRLATDLGADRTIDPSAEHLVDQIGRHTGRRGVDLVVECVGVQDSIQPIPYIVRRGGMVAQIGGSEHPVLFDYGYIHFKHFAIVPSDYLPTLRQVADQVTEVFALIESGAVNLRDLITHRFLLADLNRAFELLRHRPDSVVKIAIDCS